MCANPLRPVDVTRPTRVLGVDTSLRSTGIAVVEARGGRTVALEYGTIRNKPDLPVSECLRRLSAGIDELMDRHHPDVASIEGVFFARNARTAMVLGQARGAVIAACARRGVSVYEYAPRRVKGAVVGFGAASKEQIQKMVMNLLGLPAVPQADAGDALALALCHLSAMRGNPAFWPEPL